MKKILLLLVVMFSFFSTAKAAEGYDKTKWGMTPDEVVLAEKGKAHIQPTPDVFTKGKGFVKIDSIKIGIDEYKVDFIFDENKHLVMVNVVSPTGQPEFINQRKFKSLESLLTQKYGKPEYSDENVSMIWDADPTTLNLTHTYIAGSSYMIAVSYYPSIDVKKDTDGL